MDLGTGEVNQIMFDCIEQMHGDNRKFQKASCQKNPYAGKEKQPTEKDR